MDELDQALLRLRRSVERGVHVKLNRAAPLPSRVQSERSLESAIESSSREIVPASSLRRTDSGLWARLGEIALGRFRR